MSSTEAQSGSDNANQLKQAACLECRRSKIKCIRDPDASICKRCQSNASECVIPEYHVGRYKGVKKYTKLFAMRGERRLTIDSKRTGLEKAIYQVEQAIKRKKGNDLDFDAEPEVDLKQLIDQSHKLTQQNGDDTTSVGGNSKRAESILPPTSPRYPETMTAPQLPRDATMPEHVEKPGALALNNADNPLQLLAMASTLPNQSPAAIITPSPAAATSNTAETSDVEDSDLPRFFGNLTPVLDNTADIDPVEMGLVTEEEAESLFKYFYEHLSHTRWGLDPVLHTSGFVRSRSAFLFTSLLAATATFLPNTAALAKRLSVHRGRLAQRVINKQHRSVEIVVAFMVNIPWMAPAKHWADDETCAYLSFALTLALDIQLNKIVVPSPTIRPPGFMDRAAKADCIDATRALQLDGFAHVDPNSSWGRRLLRTRERVWLALFVLDRGICLARGRPYAVPTGPLIDSCDTWHISDIAGHWDGSIISTAVLRRDLIGLIASVRETCDNTQMSVMSGSTAVKFLKDKIDRFFDQWYSVWSFQISQGDGNLPPYVEILVSHTKLSAYCSVINHPTASSDVKQFFRAAGLASALNVMRAVVQGESRLKSIPNNSVIMVSFAACFALGLSTTDSGDRATLKPNVRSLVEQTAQVLERIGTTPKHRNGTSALFGRHIRRIVRTSFLDAPVMGVNDFQRPQLQPQAAAASPATQKRLNDEPFEFNMTDDQIIEAINNASQSQELFHLDENMFLDWLEWPNTT